jgi:hypothetical protein
MRGDDLRKTLTASPFQPFTIVMAGEKSYAIEHPEFAWLTPNGRTLCVAPADDDGLDLLDVALITRLEVRPKRAGSKRKD